MKNDSLPPPANDPRRMIKSIFDLAYGAQDGTEPRSAAEVDEYLRDAGIDPEAAWRSFQQLAGLPTTTAPAPSAAPKTLQPYREARLANPPPPLATQVAASAEAILADIKQLLSSLGPAEAAAVFGRKWEHSSPEDLAALHEQLKRQVERNRSP